MISYIHVDMKTYTYKRVKGVKGEKEKRRRGEKRKKVLPFFVFQVCDLPNSVTMVLNRYFFNYIILKQVEKRSIKAEDRNFSLTRMSLQSTYTSHQQLARTHHKLLKSFFTY